MLSALVYVCVCSKFMCWNPNPTNVMEVVGGAFERWVGHVSGTPITGIRALIKETPQSSLVLSITWGHSKKIPFVNQKEGPHWNATMFGSCRHLNLSIWETNPPEPWEMNFCCLPETQHVVFCYSNPNRLRHTVFHPRPLPLVLGQAISSLHISVSPAMNWRQQCLSSVQWEACTKAVKRYMGNHGATS